MQFFVVLLAIGLSASEKLNRVYLPPPGAKLAGGRSEDLQTPLEYPKETTMFGPENSAKARVGSELQSEIFKTVNFDVKTGDEEALDIPVHLNSGFEISVTPMGLGLKSTVENSQNGLKYPLNGKYTEKKGIFNHWNSRDNFGEPGNMPIIPIPKDIMQNYEPKAFGMYGGNPMIIKSYTETPQNLQVVNMFGNHNANHLNHTSDDISTLYESFKSNSQKPVMSDAVRTFSKSNRRILPEVAQNIAVISRPDKQEAEKYLQKKKERPQALDRTAVILNYKNVLTPEGFVNSFDTSNGIHIDESASTLDGVKAQGSYSFTGDDGKVYSITYTADENGFQPKGDHLPTPPPIPEAIQKVIEQANKDKEAGIFHDGSYDEKMYGHMKYQGPVNRYLHNKQESLDVRNRKRVLRPRKMNKAFPMKDVIKDYESNHENNVQQSYVIGPLNNLNGQYGIKRRQSVQRNKTNLIKGQNGDNSSRRRIPTIEVDNFKQRLRKTNVSILNINDENITVSENIPLQSSTESNRKYKGSQYNDQINGHFNSMTNKQVATMSEFNKNKRLEMSVPENGYYYVPPRNMFIEEKFQNKLSLEGFSEQNSNLDIKSVPVTGFYYIGQNKDMDQFPEKLSTKITSDFTREEPLNLQTYGNDFNEITNHEVEQSIKDEKTATEKTSNENIVIVTTRQPYENTLATNPSNQAYEEINHQEDTVTVKNRVENGIPSTRKNPSTANYLSTTPIPSQVKYTSNQLSDSNQHKTNYLSIEIDNTTPSSATNYVANEGYYQTIPVIPETLEDISTSTYKPTYTVDEFQTEKTQNIKVDGFGRPIQDISLSNNNANLYYTNGLFGDEFRTNGEIGSTVSYYNEYEKDFKSDKATTLGDSKSSSGFLSKDFGFEDERTTHNSFGNDKVTSFDSAIENDFSGPKQPQSYDPDSGYFY